MNHIEWQRVVLPGEPASKARPRLGKGRVYTPSQTVDAEEAWRWALRQTMPCEPVDDAAFAVRLRFFSGSWKRKDIDNMVKLVLDACTGFVWVDDRQVVGIDAWLYRGESEPRTELGLRTVDQPLSPTISCLNCGTSVPLRMNRQRDGSDRPTRFCSAACSFAVRRDKRLCPACGVEFIVPSSNRNQKHCSRLCAGTAGGVASSVSPEQLRKAVGLIAQGSSKTWAAKTLGVSANALSRALLLLERKP